MSIHGEFDHELKIGDTTERFRLVRDDNKAPMYSIENFVPQYRNPLTFTQTDWKGGHGQHTMRVPDKYFEGQSIDTTQDGRVFLGPLITTVLESDDTALDSAPVKFVWFPATSEWLCATSGKIYRYNVGANLKWTAATTTVAGITDLCVFGATIFAACGGSVAYKYSTDGITWTTCTLTDCYATYFFVAPNSAGTAEVLWKAVTNELKSNASGIIGGAQWSTAAYIGDASTNITNIFLVNDNLLIGKTDGLWYYDPEGGIHQLRPDLAKNISADNFKYTTEWSAGVYFSEINGMGEITSRDAYDAMGPLKNMGDIGKRGNIVGLAADKDFLYVAIDEGTNTHIYKGREIYREGIGLRWEWCPWVFLSTYTCATIATCQHSTSDRRLWFGYTTGTTYATAYVILSDNPTADSAAKFCTSGFLRMSYDYGTETKWDKLWQSAVLEVTTTDVSTGAKGATSGETVQVQYRKDTDTSVTECIPAFTTNGITETNFSSELACNRIQFQINLASNTSTATPEVSYFQVKGVEKPTTTRIHEAVYSIGDEPTVRAQTLRDLLRTARASSTLLRFSDLRYLGVGSLATGGTAGTDFVYCVMEPGYPQEPEAIHRGRGTTPELGIRVRLREVSVVTSFPTITATEQYVVGDILYASSTSQLSRLARGTRGLGSASVVVAASDASAGSKILADKICDGTDDKTEIAAAITAADGDLVELSDGTFYLGSSYDVPTGCHLRGQGIGKTIVQLTNVNAYGVFMLGALSNVIIEDMTLQLVDGTGSYRIVLAIYGAADSTVEFRNVKFDNARTTGASLVGVSAWGDTGVEFENCSANGGSSSSSTCLAWQFSGTSHPHLLNCNGDGGAGSGTLHSGLKTSEQAHIYVEGGRYIGGGTGTYSDGITAVEDSIAGALSTPSIFNHVYGEAGGGTSCAGFRFGRTSHDIAISPIAIGGVGATYSFGITCEDTCAPTIIDPDIRGGATSYGLDYSGGTQAYTQGGRVSGGEQAINCYHVYLGGNAGGAIVGIDARPIRHSYWWTYDDANTGRFQPFAGHPYMLVGIDVDVLVANAGITLDLGTSAAGTQIAAAVDIGTTGFKRINFTKVEIAAAGYLYATPSGAIADGDITVCYTVVTNYAGCSALYVYSDKGTWRINGGYFLSNGASDAAKLQQDTGATDKLWRIAGAVFETLDPTNQKSINSNSAITDAPIYLCTLVGGQTNITSFAAGTARGTNIEQ